MFLGCISDLCKFQFHDTSGIHDTSTDHFSLLYLGMVSCPPCKLKLTGPNNSSAALFVNGQPQNVITLNVCGTIMVTIRPTLQLCNKSALASKFSTKEEKKQNSDPYCFEEILEHLQLEGAFTKNPW